MKPGLWHVLVLGLAAVPARPAIAQNTIRLRIANEYFAYINAGIGNARRVGVDTLEGTLTLQSNGTWQGQVQAKARFRQVMQAFGVLACPEFAYEGSQHLLLTGRPASGFNALSQTITTSAGAANGGFLELVVEPLAPPVMNSMDCLSLYEDAAYSFPLLPLNDARWNQPTSGYIIGLPQSGVLEYTDGTVQTFQTNFDFSKPAEAASSWKIRVERQ